MKPTVCDRPAKRFAQDDGCAEGLTHIWRICRKHEKIEKVTGSQDDDFVGGLKKNIQNKLALMGVSPGFPVDLVGVDELHAAFFDESRTRACLDIYRRRVISQAFPYFQLT
jgi:hypothetical protein